MTIRDAAHGSAIDPHLDHPISSMVEYAVAIALLFRYAGDRGRQDLTLFARCMLVHMAGGLFILAYHATNDGWQAAIDLGRTFNGLGSVSLAYGAAMMRVERARTRRILSGVYAVVAALVVAGLFVSWLRSPEVAEAFTKRVFIVGNSAYLAFAVLLIVIRRRDPEAFSALTVFGFWFMFVFVGVSGWAMHQAVQVKGLPTLDHDDVLHGFAEAFLTITNLLVVFGIQRQRRAYAPSAVAHA